MLLDEDSQAKYLVNLLQAAGHDMDKLNHYREVVQRILTEYYELSIRLSAASNPKLESVLVFDSTRDRYLLLTMGWQGEERISSMTIHIALKNYKIWIEEDWTEDGVATDLLNAGVPKEDIVLAFHPPHLRQYTEFAIA
jgi:XisI protein